MSPVFAYTLRNLARRRTRTVVGVLGIFFTLTLLTAIQAGLDSISLSYVDLVSLQAGKADLLVRVPGGSPLAPTPFDPAEAMGKLGSDPVLSGVSPRLLGIVRVAGGTKQLYAVLVGVDGAKERALGMWGVWPDPPLGARECALSGSLAQKLGLSTGGRLTLSSPALYNESDFRVGGVVEKQFLLPQQIRDFVLVDLAGAREVLGEPTQVHLLAGALRDPRACYDARDLHASVLRLKNAGEAIAASLGMDYEVRLPKAEAIAAFQNFTSPARAFFGVFAILTLTVAGLLIYSLISVAVEERVREYAILRTIGGRRSDILKIVLGESCLLCGMGMAPGLLFGLGMARLLVMLITAAAHGEAVVELELTAQSVWLLLAGGLAVALGSALVPALQATRRTIVDGLDPLRGGQVRPDRPGPASVFPFFVLTGGALSLLSGVVFFVLPPAVLSGNPSLIGTVVLSLLVLLMFGLTLVTVGFLPWVERMLVALLGWAFHPVAVLAARNLQRHRRRHTTTALLFTLSVALVIFVASLVALASGTALGLVEHSYGADVRISVPRLEAEDARADLENLPGVAAVSEVRFLRPRSERGTAYDVVISDLVGMKHLWVIPCGVDSRLSECLYTNRIVWSEGGGAALAEVGANASTAGHSPPIVLSQAVASYLEVQTGDEVQLMFQLGAERSQARFRVVGIASALPGFQTFRARVAHAVGAGVVIPAAEFERLTRLAPRGVFQAMFFLKTSGNPGARQVAREIRERFDVRYQFSVQSTAEARDHARAVYWITQVLFALLLIVAVVIAVFALIASMAGAVLERRREVGVLKALGLRRGGLFKLFLLEALVLTLSAGIAGGVVGFALAWLFVYQATVLMEIAAAFTMPYLTFAATLVISLLAGLLASYIPTRSLLRQTAAGILRG
jgi:putative ABC transport system permease protein